MPPRRGKVKQESVDRESLDEPVRKRRRGNSLDAIAAGNIFSFDPLLNLAALYPPAEDSDNEPGYDDIFEELAEDFLRARNRLLIEATTVDSQGRAIREFTRAENETLRRKLESHEEPLSHTEVILSCKLKSKSSLSSYHSPTKALPSFLRLPPPLQPAPSPPNSDVISALHAIRTTPYANSFASRLYGGHHEDTNWILRDWETRSPWMELMKDIRDHYSIKHPEREHPSETIAPIDYVTLQPKHLPQIHDLLSRTFWPGINVTDSLYHSPERCTIVALYKHLVVGAAFMSSPNETYITYIFVRAGWEDSQIATFMLYHLIMANSNYDVTLHVSATSPAMVLYNRFGFKAEEFIVGFYEEYLDSKSRGCKNAFRLRLRR